MLQFGPLPRLAALDSAVTSAVIWNAPEAIPEVCYGENKTNHAGKGIACGSLDGGAAVERSHAVLRRLQRCRADTDLQ